MLTKLRYDTALLALVFLAHLPTTQGAIAITVELARKCGALTDKAYPLRVPGNPAAGREHGTAKDVRDYFNKCVANRGNIGSGAPPGTIHPLTTATLFAPSPPPPGCFG
jgi:hypothetical protein